MKKRAWNIGIVIVWGVLIFACIYFREDITVEGILRYTPENPFLAAFVVVFLFALKSVSIVIYAGILYTVVGILFPLPAAIFLNLLGMAVMVSVPYGIGRKVGGNAAKYVVEKYPQAEKLHDFRSGNDFLFAYLVRMVGHLPSDVVSLYMGAAGIKYRPYLSGSFLGMAVHVVTFSIMGENITDLRSPAFLISAGVEIAVIVGTVILYRMRKRRN